MANGDGTLMMNSMEGEANVQQQLHRPDTDRGRGREELMVALLQLAETVEFLMGLLGSASMQLQHNFNSWNSNDEDSSNGKNSFMHHMWQHGDAALITSNGDEKTCRDGYGDKLLGVASLHC
ncbi:hypothetical protein Dimus_006131 [Dionaea muscipula]